MGKRFRQLTQTATDEDLVEGNYFGVDTPNVTMKVPANLLAKQSGLESTNGNVTALAAYAQNVAHSIAPEYNGTTGAVAGRLYMNEGVLYKCKENTSGDWDSSKFYVVDVEKLLGYINSYFANVTVTYDDGYYISHVNGYKNVVTSRSASDPIDVEFANKITLIATCYGTPDLYGAAFYDDDSNFISGYQYATNNIEVTLDVPSNAKYFRFTTMTADKNVTVFKYSDVFGSIEKNIEKLNALLNLYCKNSYPITWSDGNYIAYVNGNMNSGSNNSASDYISLIGVKKVRLKAAGATSADLRGAAFYDSLGVYISGYQYPGSVVDVVLNVPSGASYMRVTTATASKETSYVELLDAFDAIILLNSEQNKIKDTLLKTRPSITWVDGYYISGGNGNKVSYSGYSCVDKFDIRGFSRISFVAVHAPGNVGYAFYDLHGIKMSAAFYTSGSGLYVETVDVPAGACFFSFCAKTTDKAYHYLELQQTNIAVLNHGKVIKEFQERELVVPFSMFSNFGVCGDSYSSGQIYNASEAIGVFPKVSWGKILERMTGAECFIYSNPGMDVRLYRTHSNCLPKLLSETAKELYIFALGINDYAHEIPAGTISDIDDSDPDNNADTYIGNYGYIIQKTLDHAPNAKIIIMKSIRPRTKAGNVSDEYTAYSAAVEALANHYNCLFAETLDDVYLSSPVYISGKIHSHPTAALYAGMANAFNEIFRKLLYANYTYFNTFTPE